MVPTLAVDLDEEEVLFTCANHHLSLAGKGHPTLAVRNELLRIASKQISRLPIEREKSRKIVTHPQIGTGLSWKFP